MLTVSHAHTRSVTTHTTHHTPHTHQTHTHHTHTHRSVTHTDHVAAAHRHSATMFLALPHNFINKIA